ncbi:MAG: FlgD immunoglobulin-like domain containing protein [bacterium]
MKIIYCLLLWFPFLIYAQEHNVPTGSEDNQLALAVENAFPFPLRGLRVAIRSAPTWVVFKTTSVVIDSIPSMTWADAVFEFSVLETAANQSAAVLLAITEAHGAFSGSRLINLRTVALPQKTELFPPYPNPANPGATIRYTLHTSSHVKLEIYNILGQRVRTLFDEERPAGTFIMNWDGRDDQGLPMSSGTYLVRLVTNEKGKDNKEQFSSKIIIRK